MTIETEDNGSALMKIVEAISITPQDARSVVSQYEAQARAANPNITDARIRDIVIKKIIKRYSKMASASGGATSLAGVIPGVGTAVSMIGGGLADISICMKFQIDMTMCLGVAINNRLSNEDAKHMSFIIALSGSLEGLAAGAATRTASKATLNLVSQYLKGATLKTIKQLFKQVGIKFTQKAAMKSIPFGVGVVISSAANYFLTRYIGGVARDIFLLEFDPEHGN